MKKFWNLMLAALVIFGAVACTENQEENIPEAKKEPVLSFVANIDVDDETRTILEQVDGQWTTNWTGDDKLYVSVDGGVRYEFKNSPENKEVFTCYDNGVLDLIGQPVQIDNNNYGPDSRAEKAGAYLYGYQVFDPTTTITLDVQSAFFHFTAAQEVTLKASKCIFGDEYIAEKGYVDTITFSAGEHWVAFVPDECTLSYSIDGYECKDITKKFEAKKIYNLGTLDMPEVDVHVMVKDLGWSDVYMVVGDKATKITKTKTINSNTFYTAEVTLGSKISFRNGEKAANDKRMVDTDFDGKDITIAKKDTYLRLSVHGAVDIDPNDVSTFRYGICVFDQKNKQKAPNLYTWDDGDAFKSMHGGNFGSWPGVAFKDEAYYKPADGNGWKRYYYYEIPTSRYDSGFKFIVNKSGQTADLKVSKVTGDLYVGYWFDSDSSNGFWANSPYTTIIE